MNRTARLWLGAAAALAVTSFGQPRDARAQYDPWAPPPGEPLIFLDTNVWLSWNSCYGAPGSSSNLRYACDASNDGNPLKLVISFELPRDYAFYKFRTTKALIRFRTLDSGPLPDYWAVQKAIPSLAVPCRDALRYTKVGIGVNDPEHCANWTEQRTGRATTGNAGGYRDAGPDQLRVEAVSGTVRGPFAPDDHTYGLVEFPAGSKLSAGAVLIETASDGCAGCLQPMSIELVSLEVSSHMTYDNQTMPTYVLTGSGPGTFVTWQGLDPGTTVVRNRTWGAVKSLYR